jgi:phage protein D
VSNYVSVTFPNASIDPTYVYSLTLQQKFYEHEVLSMTFKDWAYSFDNVKPGTPVEIQMRSAKDSREFYGYVHHVEADKTPGRDFATIHCVGGSFPLKQSSQLSYKNVTANMVVEEIANKHGLVAIADPHPRLFPQIAHPGLTDWQMLVKLAKQVGWGLRTENTEVYFQPLLEDYKTYRAQAPRFFQRPVGHGFGGIYSFNPVVGDSINYDGDVKAAVAVAGVDKTTKSAVKSAKQKRRKVTRRSSQDEFFDRYNTDAVAPSLEIMEYEAEAAELRNAFPYRATVKVIGQTRLRPGMPVFLGNLGKDYSGFWTVLGTEHHYEETQTKVYTYTTTLTVGTDSLGGAVRWEDGQTIDAPEAAPKRVVVPGKRQTKKRPKTKLVRTGIKVGPQTKGSFGKIKNRPKIVTAKNSTAVWKTGSKNLSKSKAPTTEKRRSPAVTARVQRAAARTR